MQESDISSWFLPLFTTYLLLSCFYCLSSWLQSWDILINASRWTILWHCKSLCMIKFCRSTPSISVYLAEWPAFDQEAANLSLKKETPYLMSWLKRFKSSHVLGMFCKQRFLWDFSEARVRSFGFPLNLILISQICEAFLDYCFYEVFNRLSYIVFLLQHRLLTAAFYMLSIQYESSTCSAIAFSAELNKHSAILLFAWPWNQAPPLDIWLYLV